MIPFIKLRLVIINKPLSGYSRHVDQDKFHAASPIRVTFDFSFTGPNLGFSAFKQSLSRKRGGLLSV